MEALHVNDRVLTLDGLPGTITSISADGVMCIVKLDGVDLPEVSHLPILARDLVPAPEPLVVGDRVVNKQGLRGTIISINDEGDCTVQLDGIDLPEVTTVCCLKRFVEPVVLGLSKMGECGSVMPCSTYCGYCNRRVDHE